MRNVFIAVAALASLSFAFPASADPPGTPRWRPATAAEIGSARAQAAEQPMPAQPREALPAAPAQRAYIDPVTGRLVSKPAAPTERAPGRSQRPDYDAMRLQRTPEGFYFIDTTTYQMESRATLGADGELHLDCDKVGHHHEPATPAGEPQQ